MPSLFPVLFRSLFVSSLLFPLLLAALRPSSRRASACCFSRRCSRCRSSALASRSFFLFARTLNHLRERCLIDAKLFADAVVDPEHPFCYRQTGESLDFVLQTTGAF